jgi:hypothetical protein
MSVFRKLHDRRAPPGLERVIWRRLPIALVLSILVPAALSAGTRLFPPQGSAYEIARTTGAVDIFSIALCLTSLAAVVTVAIGCIVVMIMKGPAYVADGIELESPSRPTVDESGD